MDATTKQTGQPPDQQAPHALRPAGHPQVRDGRVGVLIVNLGTPDGTDYWSMRRYLAEFLTDRRVIEWSPLLLVSHPLRHRAEPPAPARRQGLCDDLEQKAQRGLPADLYPQPGRRNSPSALPPDRRASSSIGPCATATPRSPSASPPSRTPAPIASSYFPSIRSTPPRRQPPSTTRPSMRCRPCAGSRRCAPCRPITTTPSTSTRSPVPSARHLATLDWQPEVLLASFHGIPQSYFANGDPYHCHCQKTARLLRDALGYDERRLRTTFQSRFGPRAVAAALHRRDRRRASPSRASSAIAVINPGFVSDCLETLEEIAVLRRDSFRHNGGEKFAHIPCLNDSPDGIAVLAACRRARVAGVAVTRPIGCSSRCGVNRRPFGAEPLGTSSGAQRIRIACSIQLHNRYIECSVRRRSCLPSGRRACQKRAATFCITFLMFIFLQPNHYRNVPLPLKKRAAIPISRANRQE